MAARADRMGINRAIRMLCVVALVLLGLAHRPPVAVAMSLTPVEIAAMTLPDGTVPELCLTGMDDEGKGQPHLAVTDCEACRISAAVLLPEPADNIGVRLARAANSILPKPAEAHYRQLFPPSSAPRAPPIPA